MVGASDDRRFGDGDGNGGGDGWDQEDDRLETAQLELTGAEERLPWLESAEDDDPSAYEGYDTGRMVLLFALAIVALGVVVGGIWWFGNRGADPALVADGSVIPAPDEPYKTPPQNPGGKTFDGTGDSSFAVSEGQNRPAQLAGAAADPAPLAAPAPSAAPVPKGDAAPAPSPQPPAASGVGVQVGAFSSQALAQAGWQKLVGQADGLLEGVQHRVIVGKADIGTVYRLQAVAADAAAASALCAKLKSRGISCTVK